VVLQRLLNTLTESGKQAYVYNGRRWGEAPCPAIDDAETRTTSYDDWYIRAPEPLDSCISSSAATAAAAAAADSDILQAT
jgi:hypothetical protein